MTGGLRRLAAWLGERVGPEAAAAILSVVAIVIVGFVVLLLGIVGR